MSQSQVIKDIIKDHPLIPVVTANSVDQGLVIAERLQQQAIHIAEITLRTAAALDAAKAIRHHFPHMIIAIGTITAAEQLNMLTELKPAFIVSPGFKQSILEHAKKLNIPFLPGAMTATEMLHLQQQAITLVKFFPAEQAGGVKALQSYQAVFPSLQFCPTGGINQQNYQDYLALKNVLAVGGSWMSKQD